MTTHHSLISPSNFERRMICPGSLNAEKDLPHTTSVYAEEGTMLHDRTSLYIDFLNQCRSFDRQYGSKWDRNLSEDQINAVKEAGNYYDELKDATGIVVINEWHEQTFDLSFIYPGMKGTADSVLITLNEKTDSYDLHVIDYKFGKGISVIAHQNYQLLLYYLGVVNDPVIEELLQAKKYNVHLHIVQPYKFNSVWSLNDTEKLLFSNLEMYQDVAQKCYVPDAPRVANKKACQFCKAKPTCPALASFVPNTKTKLGELSDTEIANIYDNKDLIAMYIKAIEDHIKGKLEKGSFMNYMLKPKLSNRKWNDDAHGYLLNILGDDAFETSKKLITITKAEKALGKEVVSGLTIREEGENEIVKITDKSKELFKTFNND